MNAFNSINDLTVDLSDELFTYNTCAFVDRLQNYNIGPRFSILHIY